ncbi:MAG: TetR/AcrR family transcriptional regulator [Nannocystis sp.]|nr:TetR/AcrR family transcriptional regulator [Nannocystis sp.]
MVKTPAPEGSEALREARKARRQAGRREEILAAAREVLLADGLAFTMDRVAEQADVSKAALYYYFRSKEAVVGALAGLALRHEVAVLGKALVAAPTGVEAMTAVVRAKVALYREEPDTFRILYLWSPLLGLTDARILAELHPLTEVVTAALENKLLRDQRLGLISGSLDARRLACFAAAAAQGVLAATLGLGDQAGSMRFELEPLCDEACAALRARAAVA